VKVLTWYKKEKSPENERLRGLCQIDLKTGGERGIRTPGNLRFNGFQDRRIRPLCHLSGAKIQHELIPMK
jgi:hypothetical protein